MKEEKLKLLLNKIVELDRLPSGVLSSMMSDAIYCKGFLYKDSNGYYVSVVEADNHKTLKPKDKVYLVDGDEDRIKVADKPKLMRVSLKSWHYRLVKWVLKDNAPTPKTMQNGCPYFWLLLFSLIATPFILLAKSIWWVLILLPTNVLDWMLEQSVGGWMDNLDEEKVYDYYWNDKKRPVTAKIYFNKFKKDKDFLEYFINERYSLELSDDEYQNKKYELNKKYQEWKERNAERNRKLEEEREKARIERYEREMERERKDAIRKAKWEKNMRPLKNFFDGVANFFVAKDWKTIIKRTKQFVGFLVTVFLLAVTYFVVQYLVLGLTIAVDWSIANWFVFASIGVVAAACGILYVLYIFITGWAQNIVNKYKEGRKVWYVEPFVYGLFYPLKYIALGVAYTVYYVLYIPLKFVLYTILWTVLFAVGKFVWGLLKGLWRGIVGSSGIFGEYFSASYTAYCPGIEWVDDEE